MAESKVMRDLKERMAAVETRCPLREQIVNEQFKAVAEDLTDIKVGMSKIFDVLNNGLKQTVADHAKQIEDHKVIMKTLADQIKVHSDNGLQIKRDSQIRTRTTDLSNKKPVVKYSIIIAVISLILGNVATIGYVLSKIAEALMNVPQ